MIGKDAAERVTDHLENASSLSEGRGSHAHLPTCNICRISSGRLLHLTTPAEKIPEPCPSSANGKAQLLAGSREQQSSRSGFMSGRQREIGAAVVRVVAPVGIAWSVMIWKGIGTPTQKYQAYAVDFSTTPLLRT